MATNYLKPIKSAWLSVIKKAQDHKRREFQDDADEAMRFFDGPYDFIYDSVRADDDADDPGERWARPGFEMTYNKVAEMVQLFGPALYHRNPHRKVNPSQKPQLPQTGDPNDPNVQMMEQQLQQQRLAMGHRIETLAKCLETYLNYTPNELDLRGESRQVVDEALIKGMGVWWTSQIEPPGSPIKLVGSFYDSVDNLVLDPDMESIEHAKWAARRRVFPVWEVEERWKLPKGTLRGNLESRNHQAQIDSEPDDYQYDRSRGDTNDLFTYWEVYSRMGLGHALRTSHDDKTNAMRSMYDQLGKHCFLAVSEDYHCPLNLPDYATGNESPDAIFDRVQWPIPFWLDHSDPWPFTYVAFHKRPRKLWPMSHIKPAMGELRFLNWAFSFIAQKIKNTSRDFIAIAKSVGEEMKNTILKGGDLELIEIESAHGNTIANVVSFLQHPQFNGDVYKVIDVMMNLLERRLGLNELMYGDSSRQLRSASEAQIKGDQIKLRPDDMAECVEVAATKMSRKEAMAVRWTIDAQNAAPIVGPELAMAWPAVVENSNPHEVVLELAYRIEAGSIRKPNKNRDMENANSALQQWGPLITQHLGMTGDVGPANALAEFWCDAFDFPKEKLRFNPPPPPQPDQTKIMEIQAEQQAEQQRIQMEAQGEQQKMMLELEKTKMELQLKMQEMAAKIEAMREESRMKLQLAMMEGQQKLQLDAAAHRQEMVQDQQSHAMDIQQQREQGAVQVQVAEVQGRQKIEQAKQQGEMAKKQGDQKLRQSKREGDQKIAQQKAVAKAKPKPKPKAKAGK